MNTITVRLNPETEQALTELATELHRDRSAVVREAIVTVHRQRRAARLRAEAEALAADPEDRAEMQRVREDMDALRAW